MSVIAGLGTAEAFFRFAEQAIKFFDYKQRTNLLDEFIKIKKEIKDEEAKPIYGNGVRLRDQNRIDHLHYELRLFTERFSQAVIEATGQDTVD